MAVDTARALDLEIAPVVVEVERGRLRAFASAVGESDPVYLDLGAAQAAGHPDVPALPTFLFSLELEHPSPFGYLESLGVDLRGVLHGEQRFTYHSMVHAGDVVTCQARLVDAYAKSPTMDFLVKRTTFLRGEDLVAESESLIIARAVEAA